MAKYVLIKKDDKTISVTEAEAPAYVAQEGWSFVKPQEIEKENGGKWLVSPEEATKNIRLGRARVRSGQELEDERSSIAREKKYNTGLGAVATFTTAVGNTITGGLAEQLSRAFVKPDEDPDYDPMAQVRKFAPVAQVAGDVTGTVVGLGLGGAGQAAGAIGKVGKILQYNPLGLVGKGSTAIRGGTGLAATGRALAAGAFEGAAINTHATITDALVADHEIAGEALLDAAGTGALWGVGAEGASMLISRAASRFAKNAKKAHPVIDNASSEAKLISTTVDDAYRSAAKDIDRIMPELHTPGVGGYLSEGAVAEIKAARTKLESLVGEKGLTAALADAQPTLRREIVEAFDKVQATAAQMQKTSVEVANKAASRAATRAQGASRRLTEEVAAGNKIGLKDSLGRHEVVPDLTPKTLNIVDRTPFDAKYKLATGLEKMPNAAEVAKSLQIEGVSITHPATEFLINGAAMRSSAKAGAPEGALAQMLSYIPGGGIAKQVIGAVGKLKSKVADGMKGLVRVADKTKAFAPSKVVPVLHRISYDPGYEKSSTKYANTAQDQFKRISDEIARAAANPEVTKSLVRKRLEHVTAVSSELSAYLETKSIQKIAYLQGKLPKHGGVGMFGGQRWQPSKAEIDKFTRYLVAAENPTSVLKAMADGKLTPEAAAAVKELYPRIYEEMQNAILDNYEAYHEKLDYRARIQLSILTGVPVDDVMRPELIAAMQQNFVVEEKPGPNNGAPNQPMPAAAHITVGIEPTLAQGL